MSLLIPLPATGKGINDGHRSIQHNTKHRDILLAVWDPHSAHNVCAECGEIGIELLCRVTVLYNDRKNGNSFFFHKKSPCPKSKGRQRASPARETLLSSPLRSDRSFRSGTHIISQASAARQQIGRAAPCNFGILFQLFLTYAFPPKSRIILTAASEKSSASTSSVLLSTPRASTLTDVAF